ncbi:condensation domain-containing protein [Pendulispora rubella]|uniref:Phthiocerol/phthiodiolone dimycocerosyl transferase n=1 Tax=Pendulispora rubella TaxID=2741070 RepID=A0ABZ2KP05_9BACT
MNESVSSRKLCRSEAMLWKFDQAASINGTVTAKIKGHLTDAALRTGLVALQARHPYLRTHIDVDERGAPWFRFDKAGPLPLRVVTIAEPEWVAELEREANDKFRWSDGPLARCVLLRHGPEDATIFLTMHHAICDGQSILFAMRDLLESTARAARGEAPELSVLEDVRAVEDRLPAKLFSRKGAGFLYDFVSDEIRLRMKYGAPFRMPRDEEVPLDARHFKCRPTVLDEERTAKLLARARAEGTTIHGALCAATILAILRDAGVSRPVQVFLGSAVSVRNDLVPAVGDDVGYYASSQPYRAPVDPDASFWDLARSVRGQMIRGRSRGDAIMMLDFGSGMYRLMGGDGATPLELAHKWNKLLTGLGVSNMGRQDFTTDFSPFSLDGLYLSAALSAFTDFVTSAMTFRDRLVITFLWAEPVIRRQRAIQLGDSVHAHLEQAIM